MKKKFGLNRSKNVLLLCGIISVVLFFFGYICIHAANAVFTALLVFLETQQFDLIWPNLLIPNTKMGIFYVLDLFFALLLTAKIGYQISRNLKPLNNNQKGSRQWTTVEQLDAEYRSIPESTHMYSGKSGFPISRYGKKIYIDDSPVNNLIIGTTRSGKGESYVIPAIDIYSRPKNMKDRPSLILADTKGELAAASAKTLISRGYDVQIFDLLNFKGLSYNPLQLIKEAYLKGEKEEAQLLANTLSTVMFNDPNSKDKTWENWSRALTTALILSITIDTCAKAASLGSAEAQEEELRKINLYSVSRLLADLGEIKRDDAGRDLPSAIDSFFSHREINDIARIQYAAVASASGKTKGNIFANTLSVLVKFTFENIAKMTADNSIDLKSIGFDASRPTAVFLVMPDYDVSNHFLVTMFISQLYYTLAKTASVNGGKCTREVVFLLDEFGNITPIPDMANIIAVCLGRNIRFTLIVQAYSQIYHQYGNDNGKTIMGSCGNQIYLLTIENDTAERFSKLIGNETIMVTTRSGDSLSLQKKFSEHIDTKPLLNPNELMELVPGESVVVRITKRTDLHGNKITPNPIFNHGKTRMKYRYEYLNSTFDTETPFESVYENLLCRHGNLLLEDIRFQAPDQPPTQGVLKEMPMEEPAEKRITDFSTPDIVHLESLLPGITLATDFTVSQFLEHLQNENRLKASVLMEIRNICNTYISK